MMPEMTRNSGNRSHKEDIDAPLSSPQYLHSSNCRSKYGPCYQTVLLLMAMVVLVQVHGVTEATRVDEAIREDGQVECIKYDDTTGLFTLMCSFTWTGEYPEDGYILLKAHEIFDGNNEEIDLHGVDDWEGLFQICKESVSSLQNAPTIKRLHMRNGQTSYTGGFIVQERQNNFIVDS